nr:uncharacterized protein LOC109158163 [Ipomoea batatas]
MENRELMLGQNHKLGLEQNQQMALGGLGHSMDGTGGLAMEQKPENEGQALVLTGENNELDISEHNELAVVDHQELDENMDLAVVENHDMGIDSGDDMLQHGQMVLAHHVLQARTIAATPDFELHVGQEFPDVKSCRRALRDTAIALHFEMQTIKSDKTRFTAKCASEGCPWRIHAAKIFLVCPPSQSEPSMTAIRVGELVILVISKPQFSGVANSVEQRLRENPNYKPKEILEEIHRVPMVKRTNPGSIASVYSSPSDENDDNWMCFFPNFITYLRSIAENMPRLTILSDRQKGIVDGVEANFPTAFQWFLHASLE